MSTGKRLSLAGLFAITASAASAADLPPPPPPVPQGWVITLGIGPNLFTSFPGASSVSLWPTGYITARRAGEPVPFVAADDGLGIALFDIGWLKAGPVARFISQRTVGGSFGTVIGNNQSFFGLHDIGFTAELGGFVEIWPAEFFRARFEARQGISGARGFDANIAFDFIQKFGLFTLSAGPRLQFADTRFVNAFFSVTPWEAFLNGNVTPYQATGGLTSAGGLGAIKYDFTPSWSATAFGGVNRYVGSAGTSPIPNRLGSVNNFTAGVIVAYSFNWTGF
ncbi:MAG: MipA/OmpV family protein [Beijerinckiaceae bacterium]|nr:MipA/OmpV family protein [Beijerinckiaceae bacterium]MCI0601272.1 MipA/OmpV family protein [Beijerinckiaceae bacterium]